MTSKDTLSELKLIVGNEFFSDAVEDRLCYSYDATRQSVLPEAVVRPESTEQVSAIMKLASAKEFAVYPRGAGTGMSGGAVPVMGGVVLEMGRMNRILELDPQEMLAVVEPGVVVSELQKKVESLGLFYPPDPASSDFCTIGGNVAECAGGMRCLKYGVTRDFVLALEVVLASGEVIHTGRRTLKDVAGYDLTRLFVGSEGTLGVFTKITLRLLPLPAAVGTVFASFQDTVTAAEAASRIASSKVIPRAMEFMDAETIRCIINHGDFGYREDMGAALLVDSDGEPCAVEEETKYVAELCRQGGATAVTVAIEAAKRDALWAGRRAISAALYSIAKRKINEDICVPRTKLGEAVTRFTEIGKKHNVRTVNYGHAGDGNIHMNVLIADLNDADEARRAESAITEMFQVVMELGGSISGEHGIGTSKAQYLHLQIPPAEMELMKGIKKLFDPKSILNPGKIFC